MMVVARRQAMRLFGAALGFGCMLTVTGCDYWPPALQAQIEQLRSEIQTLTIEKTQLQSQLTELSKAKQELLAQLDESGRMNREKSVVITNLQRRLDALRAKSAKTKAPAKGTAKPATKSAAKQPVKKKAPPKH
jgi:chromosome segregation ATPase